uniref:Uncharacterized protein n=1 Tax=Solanum tuberosum TaxID=4113 RepID=M1DWQ8_SOLTU
MVEICPSCTLGSWVWSWVIGPVAPVNEPADEYTARGHSRGRGRERARGRGRGRVAPARGGVSVDNAPRNEIRSTHHEDIDENVEVENEEDVGQ